MSNTTKKISLNQQPIEKSTYDVKGILDVHSVWYTLQGEGPFSGCPAAFVRLAGCNLQCPDCDTEYTKTRKNYDPQELLTQSIRVREMRMYYLFRKTSSTNLIVLTGGEPFRQNIVPFVIKAMNCGWHIQIETNGTLWVENFEVTDVAKPTIVCAPKTAKLNEMLMPRITALKYVVDHEFVDKDGLPIAVLGMKSLVARPWPTFRGDVFISPEDTGDEKRNKINQQLAVDICMKHGYRLSLQTHKIVGVP